MPPAGFEPTTPASDQPQTPLLRPRGQWDRLQNITEVTKSIRLCGRDV